MSEVGSDADVHSDAAPTLKPKIVEKVRSMPNHLVNFILYFF
jgi:hypothetical protein